MLFSTWRVFEWLKVCNRCWIKVWSSAVVNPWFTPGACQLTLDAFRVRPNRSPACFPQKAPDWRFLTHHQFFSPTFCWCASFLFTWQSFSSPAETHPIATAIINNTLYFVERHKEATDSIILYISVLKKMVNYWAWILIFERNAALEAVTSAHIV